MGLQNKKGWLLKATPDGAKYQHNIYQSNSKKHQGSKIRNET